MDSADSALRASEKLAERGAYAVRMSLPLPASRSLAVLQERWNRLEQIFAEVLALPPAARSALLARRCGDDTELRRELDELLHSHATAGVLDTAPLATAALTPPASLAAGSKLGPWCIEQLIGRGGMGEVYAATRADVGFEQRAALKLLRYEAVGQLDRFHVERRILAKLEHPGIARLLDGGMAPDGRPYTVMEFVAGRTLTDYCKLHASTLAERLTLFAQVCAAVAYAHRNLVVHRDLKPDNILVTAEGTVKLLDFGIAKLLDTTAATADNEHTVAPFTPDYAAPEQLSGQAVSTATDIYALGVLLFELLTGERPLRMRGLPSTQALQLLLNRDAPAPSHIAQANTDTPVSARLLVGDLDAIVAKCLRKEPAHRYETANGLKRDLERHLHHEPVLAREGARLYVAGRLLRRYRWVVAGIAVLIATLAAGLAGTIWQARRAETQARTAAAVQEFLSDLFRANTSHQGDPVKARQTTARELLDLGAKKIDSAMMDAPAAKLSVLQLLSQLYDDLALAEEAVRLRRQALALTRTLHGADSTEVAAALIELGGSMQASIEINEREQILSEAAAILDRLQDFNSDVRGNLLIRLAEHYDSLDKPRALEYARQAVRLFEAKPPSGDLAESLSWRGVFEQETGLLREAAVSYRHAIDVSRSVQGEANSDLPHFYAYLSEVEYRLGNIAEAEASARLALQRAIAINGENHADTVQTEIRLGRILFETGRTQQGLANFLSAQQHAHKALGENELLHTSQSLLEYGHAQVRMGLLERGLTDIQAAIDKHQTYRPGTIFVATMLEFAASALVEMGRTVQAHAYLDEATLLKQKGGLAARTARFNFNIGTRIRLALAEQHSEIAQSLINELYVDPDETMGISFTAIEKLLVNAELELSAGHGKHATELAQQVGAKIKQSGLDSYLQLYSIRVDLVLGSAALQDGHPATALPLLKRTLALREQLLAPASPRIAEAQIALADCYLALGNRPQARSLAAAAAAIHSLHSKLGEQYRRPLQQLQIKLDRR